MGANDAGQTISVRDPDFPITIFCGPFHKFLRMGSPAEKTKICSDLQFSIIHISSGKKSMNKPSRRFVFCIMSRAEQPISPTFLIFNRIIIAVKPFSYPPFGFDAFGSVGLFYFMQFPLVSEQHRWVIGNGCRYFYGLGFG